MSKFGFEGTKTVFCPPNFEKTPGNLRNFENAL